MSKNGDARRVLVTGGCGFIGANFVRLVLESRPDWQVVNLDKLTYAGNLQSLADVADNPRYRFIRGDICDQDLVDSLFADHRIDTVVHLAAESHVDRSITGPDTFIRTNIFGTFILLEPLSSIGTGRSYGVELQLQKKFSTVPLYGLVSLTANRSEYAGVDSVYYTGSFGTRFIGNLLAGWRFNPKWEVSGKYRLATGLPYTPFAASGPAEGERDFAQYNQQRLPTYSAVDIRIDRRWSFRAVQLDVYLDIQNLFGAENVTGTYWNERTQQEEFDEGLGILPTIGVNVEF